MNSAQVAIEYLVQRLCLHCGAPRGSAVVGDLRPAPVQACRCRAAKSAWSYRCRACGGTDVVVIHGGSASLRGDPMHGTIVERRRPRRPPAGAAE